MSEVAIYKGPYLGDAKHYVRLDAYNEIKAERDALTAENVALKSFVAEKCFIEDDGCDCGFSDASVSIPVTPATDAHLNSLRAEGVEALTKILQVMIDAGDFAGDEIGAIAGAVDAGNYHAAKLRAGEPS